MKAVAKVNKNYYNELELTNGKKTIQLTRGTYEIEMYGAGGGSYYWSYQKAWGVNGGGSGAGFKGVVSLPEGKYNIVVGSYNGGSTTGGTTSFSNLIICAGGGYDTHGYGSNPRGWCQGYGDGGVITVSESLDIVSFEKKTNGNTGSCDSFDGGANRYKYDGGKSVYDNTSTGWGAGQYSGYSSDGVGGYFKITGVTGHLYTNTYEYRVPSELTSVNTPTYYAINI